MEKRIFATEIRAETNQDAPTLNGYAAVFNELSQVLWGSFREKIDKGAFANTLTDDVRALWNHDTNLPLGRTKSGTLRLAEDAHGLRVEIDPPDTQAGRDAVASIKRGDVDAMSFGFDVLEDTWDRDADGMMIRTLRKIKLYEVSPVVFPAYPQTSISARAGETGALGDMPAIPDHLRGDDQPGDAGAGQALFQIRRRRLEFYARMNMEPATPE